MKKLVIIMVSLAVLLIASPFVMEYYIHKHQVHDSRYGSIVRLVREGGATFCTGTVLSDKTILTAAHCMLVQTMFGTSVNTSPVEIRDDSNTPISVYAKVYFISGQTDQALLGGEFGGFQHRNYTTAPNRLTDLRKPGTKLLSCGYPLGGNLYCNDMTFVEPNNFFWAVQGVLIPGMSGGPTMTVDGTVVAENTAVQDDMSIVSPIYELDYMIQKYEQKEAQ